MKTWIKNKTQIVWCLRNPLTGVSYDGINRDEARGIMLTFSDHERTQWLVWREDWPEWQWLADCEELTSSITRKSYPTPPPMAVIAATKEAVKTLAPPSKAKKQFIARKAKRYQVRYAIEIISGGQSFSTYSIDISLGGIQLENPLPDWVAGYCTLIVTDDQGEKLEFVATIVENQELTTKTRLEFQSSASLAILEKWLSSRVESETITRSSAS